MAKLTRKDVERIVKKAWDKGERPDLFGANLHLTDLSGADLFEVDLFGANLQLTNLSGANLWKANLWKANLSKANLAEVNLSEAGLFGTNLSGANLSGAVLTEADLTGADLSGADLSETKFGQANLSRTDLSGTKFNRANLGEVNLTKANLTGADLTEADLRGANLTEADLRGSKLNRANLSGVNLTKASLTGTDLRGAAMQYTSFGNVDLSQIKGLDAVKHWGPSYIDTHTLTRSQGKIPKVFLQGVGLSNSFINYISSFTGKAIEYHTCFISYSPQDEAFAQRLHANLQNEGIRCWFAPEGLQTGGKLRLPSNQSIQVNNKLLLVLSKHSVKSSWIEEEVYSMLEQEKIRGETCLFLILLDNTVMDNSLPGWIGQIRHSHPVGDFTRWKEHGAYQKTFEQLLHDLQWGE